MCKQKVGFTVMEVIMEDIETVAACTQGSMRVMMAVAASAMEDFRMEVGDGAAVTASLTTVAIGESLNLK